MRARLTIVWLVAALVSVLAFGQCVDCIRLKDYKKLCCQRAEGKACPMPMPAQSRPGDCPNPDGVLGSAQPQRLLTASVEPPFAVEPAPVETPQLTPLSVWELLPAQRVHGPPDIFLVARNLRI